MPLIALITLIVGIIKIAYEVIAFLEAHPEIGDKARGAVADLKGKLAIASAHADVARQAIEQQHVEAP